jgi:GDSL-like Lipase/Acylhydrolase family
MKSTLFLSCVVLAVSAHAQTGPKVVFTGDTFTYNWQQTPAFKANNNWIGAGLDSFGSTFLESTNVADDFQTNVINQHPDFVFIETGSSDIFWQIDSTPLGAEWPDAANAIVQMVDMAQKAGIKVILGNVPMGNPNFPGLPDPDSDYFNNWLQTYAQAVNIPIVNLQYWLQEGCSGLGPCAGPLATNQASSIDILIPTDAGYQFITQLAQTAIATYGQKIKGGYLSDVETINAYRGQPPPNPTQVNSVGTGARVQFTPVAQWSDGANRPMLNSPYGGVLGTWWSTNPGVIAVTQQGLAYAYNAGTATIWFQSASGVTFSPWTMTVNPVNGYVTYPPPY